MIFGWWKKRRRRQLLASTLPADWEEVLSAAVPPSRHWDSATRRKFSDNTRIFVAEKNWEGCNGLVLTDEMKVVIAAQAAMMLVGIDDYCFEGVQTVLVYPSSFRRETRQGLIVSDSTRIGEAWHRGPIVLSWIDVRQIVPGRNVVVHELAHHLDGLDGDISGNPVLSSRESQSRWETVAAREYQRLREDLAQGQRNLLDPYAATDRAEFFAVACEYFFEAAVQLKTEMPELYASLSELFNSDSAAW